MRQISLVSLLIIFFASYASGSAQLLWWNFDSATYVDATCGDINDCDGAMPAIYNEGSEAGIFSNYPSPQGGNNLRGYVHTYGDPDITEPYIWLGSETVTGWNLSKFYISFYMKIESDIVGCDPLPCAVGELESIKMFRVRCGDWDNGECAYTINMYPDSWQIYHTLESGNSCGGSCNPDSWQEDEWHKYEFYTEYNTAATIITDNTIAFFDADPDYITDSSGRFITNGFQAGMILNVSGSSLNDGQYDYRGGGYDTSYTIATVEAGKLTLDAGDSLSNEGASATVRLGAGLKDGVVRVRVDGGNWQWDSTPKLFRDDSAFVVDSIGLIFHAKTSGSADGDIDGHIRFDDVQVWDGMPGGVQGTSIIGGSS